jgi:hypothetical protein
VPEGSNNVNPKMIACLQNTLFYRSAKFAVGPKDTADLSPIIKKIMG